MEFKTKQGQKIVTDSKESFEAIRKEYFPDTKPEDWKQGRDEHKPTERE